MSKVHCTLGIHLAPDGNDVAKFEYLQEVAKQWKSLMENARMTHSAAEFRLWQVIPWKLEYPLIETMFSQRQCNEIM